MTKKTKFDIDVCTLIVVDMQNDFCSPEGKAARSGTYDVSSTQDIVEPLRTVLSSARAIGIPVVWIQTWRDEETNSSVWRARRSDLLDPPSESVAEPKCIKGSWGAEFFGVYPEPGEPIVNKLRHSAFIGTNLETVLRTIGRPALMFSGVSTNVCVESTLREALFREFHVGLIEDCCAAPTAQAHEAAVRNVDTSFGVVRTSEHVLEHWNRQAQDAGLIQQAPGPVSPRV